MTKPTRPGLHEAPEELPPIVHDRQRAISSLMEELEAVDWYDQRVHACHDDALREILAHNRDEEKEHAAMVIEWLRRNDTRFDEELRDYLFKDGSITGHEAGEKQAGATAPATQARGTSLGIGSLRAHTEEAS